MPKKHKRRVPKNAWRWRELKELDPGLRRAVKATGGRISYLADALGISVQAISQWSEIPINRIIEVERATKVDRSKLRPDLYRRR